MGLMVWGLVKWGKVAMKLPSKERKRQDSNQRGQKRIIVENDHSMIVDHKFPPNLQK